MKLRAFWYVLFVGILAVVFRNWFLRGLLSAPDFPYLYPARLGDFGWLPEAWTEIAGNGLGGVTTASLNLDTYVHAGIRLLTFGAHIPWPLASKALFFWPFVVVSAVSSYVLVRGLTRQVPSAIIGALIYTTNTYILMISGGGQVGIMLAYAVAPFVLHYFIGRNRLGFVIACALLFLFDLRFAFMTFGVLVLYALICIPRREWLQTLGYYAFPALVIVGLNAYWLLPLVLAPAHGLPEGYGNAGWLDFLSWADFSKTISLLHPNWPENIFGKTYFMQPGFLLLPALAFSALITASDGRRAKQSHLPGMRIILFAAVTGLVGAFLAKGIKPPFGSVYSWMFSHVPLFNGFRDPTKFYFPVVLAYSVLIPVALRAIADKLRRRGTFWVYAPAAAFAGFVLYWLFLISPAWKGELTGSFAPVVNPREFRVLETFIGGHPSFGRTLVVPRRQRFVFESEEHPVVDASGLFNVTDEEALLSLLRDPKTEHVLRRLAVTHVMVPHDPLKDVFLTERSYDPSIRARYVAALDALPYLDRLPQFSDNAVYAVRGAGGHFFRVLANGDLERQPEMKRHSTYFDVNIVPTDRPATIVFSERYDPGWSAWDGTRWIQSEKTPDGLNAFRLDRHVTSRLQVWYAGERIVKRSYAVTLAVVLLLATGLIFGGKSILFRRTALILLAAGVVWTGHVLRPNTIKDIPFQSIGRTGEWNLLVSPITGSRVLGSRFGGSELAFSLADAEFLELGVSGTNLVPGEQIIDVSIGGTVHEIRSPFPRTPQRFKVEAGKKPVPVTLTLHCDSALVPCDVAIDYMHTSPKARVLAGEKQPLPTLAILGDSITTSFGKENYSYLVARELEYRLHNAGIFGSTLSPVSDGKSGLLRVQEDVTAFSPQVVVIFLGTNDLAHEVPVRDFAQSYAALLDRIRKESPESRVIAIGLLRRYDTLASRVVPYNRAIRETAERHGVPYIDPYAWLSRGDYQDVVHPSRASQPKIAERLIDAMKPILKE